jgi:hypothetical protein
MLFIGSAPRNLNILVPTRYNFPPFIHIFYFVCVYKIFDEAQKETTLFKLLDAWIVQCDIVTYVVIIMSPPPPKLILEQKVSRRPIYRIS